MSFNLAHFPLLLFLLFLIILTFWLVEETRLIIPCNSCFLDLPGCFFTCCSACASSPRISCKLNSCLKAWWIQVKHFLPEDNMAGVSSMLYHTNIIWVIAMIRLTAGLGVPSNPSILWGFSFSAWTVNVYEWWVPINQTSEGFNTIW